jgi:hypothetical protein
MYNSVCCILPGYSADRTSGNVSSNVSRLLGFGKTLLRSDAILPLLECVVSADAKRREEERGGVGLELGLGLVLGLVLGLGLGLGLGLRLRLRLGLED